MVRYGAVGRIGENERKIKSSEIPFGIDGYVGWWNFGQIELLRCGVFLSDVSAKKRDDTKAVSTKSKVVKVPEGITTIGASAFWNNTFVEEIILPNSKQDGFYICKMRKEKIYE